MSDALHIEELLKQAGQFSAKYLRDEARKVLETAKEKLDSSTTISDAERIVLHIKQELIFADLETKVANMKEAKKIIAPLLELIKQIDNPELEADILHQYGYVNSNLSDYTSALSYYKKSLALREKTGNPLLVAKSLENIGVMYAYLAEYSKALDCFSRSLQVFEELNVELKIASNLLNIASIHSAMSDHQLAIDGMFKALSIFEKIDDKAKICNSLISIGNEYFHLKDFSSALENHKKAHQIAVEIKNESLISLSLGNLGCTYFQLKQFTEAVDSLKRAETMDKDAGRFRELSYWLKALAETYELSEKPDYVLAEEKLSEALEISKSRKMLKEEADIHQRLATLFRKQNRWKEADEHFQEYHSIREEIFTLEAKKQADQFTIEREIIEREKAEAIKHAALEARHQATELLLHKVMPGQIARRLLSGDEQIADYHPSVSILFADIQGFTSLTAELPPFMLLEMLHGIFSRFDALVKQHQCTKIKTIGDGYMIVAGAPESCEDHAERIVSVALEMIKPLEIPKKLEPFLPEHASLKVRVGIHSGPIVAGVVGQEAYGYDIYSDAVNVASRMETTGEAGKIHVSAEFMRHLLSRFAMTKNDGHGFTFEKRGEIEVKGKGRMKTFFLNSV